MKQRKQRKHYTTQEKVAILRRHLIERVPVSDLCEKYQLHPAVFYRWQQNLFAHGAQSSGSPDASQGGAGPADKYIRVCRDTSGGHFFENPQKPIRIAELCDIEAGNRAQRRFITSIGRMLHILSRGRAHSIALQAGYGVISRRSIPR